ncbi:MAG: hypothetical protein IT442_13070 [Phycisphaeraceae bacterium]|nr:hypothetical protein [Phycisphaeraceae bacterium]
MTTDAGRWLRMLEPALRPAGATAPESALRPPGSEAVDPATGQTFADLLDQVREVTDLIPGADVGDPALGVENPADPAARPGASMPGSGPLSPLAQFSEIQNESLRQLHPQWQAPPAS